MTGPGPYLAAGHVRHGQRFATTGDGAAEYIAGDDADVEAGFAYLYASARSFDAGSGVAVSACRGWQGCGDCRETVVAGRYLIGRNT